MYAARCTESQTVEVYVLGGFLVVALPDLVIHVDVVLRQTLLYVLRRLPPISQTITQ